MLQHNVTAKCVTPSCVPETSLQMLNLCQLLNLYSSQCAKLTQAQLRTLIDDYNNIQKKVGLESKFIHRTRDRVVPN